MQDPMRRESQFPSDPRGSSHASGGFVLALTIILILGVTAISVGTMFNGKMGRMSAVNYKHKIQTFTASDGLMTLLAQELINGKGSKYVDSTRVGKINGEQWSGIGGGDVSNLKSAMISSPTPDKLVSSYYLGSMIDEDNYGIKWTGWLIPPLSGTYTFFTRSDDGSEFYLSTDGSPGNLKPFRQPHLLRTELGLSLAYQRGRGFQTDTPDRR
jgi:hypothetical protein